MRRTAMRLAGLFSTLALALGGAHAAETDPLRAAITACLSDEADTIGREMALLGAKPLPVEDIDRIRLGNLLARIPSAARMSPEGAKTAFASMPSISVGGWTDGTGASAFRVVAIGGDTSKKGGYCTLTLVGDHSSEAVADVAVTLGLPAPPLSISDAQAIVWQNKSGGFLPLASVLRTSFSGRTYTAVQIYPH